MICFPMCDVDVDVGLSEMENITLCYIHYIHYVIYIDAIERRLHEIPKVNGPMHAY